MPQSFRNRSSGRVTPAVFTNHQKVAPETQSLTRASSASALSSSRRSGCTATPQTPGVAPCRSWVEQRWVEATRREWVKSLGVQSWARPRPSSPPTSALDRSARSATPPRRDRTPTTPSAVGEEDGDQRAESPSTHAADLERIKAELHRRARSRTNMNMRRRLPTAAHRLPTRAHSSASATATATHTSTCMPASCAVRSIRAALM